MRKIFFFFLSIMALTLLPSCGGRANSLSHTDGDTITLRHAVNLTMVDYGDYLKVTLRNPWDTSRTMQTFLLVPDSINLPASLPKGTVIRTPLTRSVVYTSVHNSLLRDLGALDAVVGVCDAQYIYQPELKARISSGEVADCGSSMSPNIEKIIMLQPQALLLSAYENSNDHNKVAQIGIPIVDCAEYMEPSPLAQAEWMRFYGRLYGKGAEADSLFDATESQYIQARDLAAGAMSKPSVIFDKMYGQGWDCPTASSTTGTFIRDAGGKNPFDSYKQSGSVHLSPEEVVYKAHDADVWLLRYAQPDTITLRQLAADSKVYTQLKPFTEGEVYGCNTQYSSFYEDVRFHPQWMLLDMVSVLHPELGMESPKHYFTRLK